MIEEISKELILLLVEERGMELHEAFDTLYTSDTYARDKLDKIKKELSGSVSKNRFFI